MDDQVTAPGAKVIRHESVLGSWEYAIAKPHAPLRPHVREYCGWIERMALPVSRRKVATDEVPIIIILGTPFRLFDQADPSRWTEFGSVAAGAYDSYVLAHRGRLVRQDRSDPCASVGSGRAPRSRGGGRRDGHQPPFDMPWRPIVPFFYGRATLEEFDHWRKHRCKPFCSPSAW